jgi:hypothetical protein
MHPIDVPHLAKICTSHVPHLGTSVPHLGPDEMAALGLTLPNIETQVSNYIRAT